jgi:hypothetical protein
LGSSQHHADLRESTQMERASAWPSLCRTRSAGGGRRRLHSRASSTSASDCGSGTVADPVAVSHGYGKTHSSCQDVLVTV